MTWLELLFQKYRQKGVIVDTNLLLLYFVGMFASDQIEKFKRTRSKGYTFEDFILLSKLLDQFQTVVTTPHVLTEISNLSDFSPDDLKLQFFRSMVPRITVLREEYLPSADLSRTRQFLSFGLADAAIVKAAIDRYLVLTDDLALASHLERERVDVVNINRLRQMSWGLA